MQKHLGSQILIKIASKREWVRLSNILVILENEQSLMQHTQLTLIVSFATDLKHDTLDNDLVNVNTDYIEKSSSIF